MKKFFTLIVAMLTVVSVQAEEKTVWEGSEQISWNTEVAPGTQFETPSGTFSGLEKENVIRVYTTTTYDDPQYVLTYKKGDSWEWTDLDISFSDGIVSYVVADETIAAEIAQRGIIVRGQAYTITKITVDAEPKEDPQPSEGEQTVWEGTEQISWNTEVAPGTQYETPEGTFSGLKKDDIIKVYTITSYDDPQYVLTYKKGDTWDWTDLETTFADGVISYTVADETVATEIAERGIIVRGQAYTITKITITKTDATAVIEIEQTTSINDDRLYNLSGQIINSVPQRGIYIKNGKKILAGSSRR